MSIPISKSCFRHFHGLPFKSLCYRSMTILSGHPICLLLYVIVTLSVLSTSRCPSISVFRFFFLFLTLYIQLRAKELLFVLLVFLFCPDVLSERIWNMSNYKCLKCNLKLTDNAEGILIFVFMDHSLVGWEERRFEGYSESNFRQLM
jgi:hypothetical protein